MLLSDDADGIKAACLNQIERGEVSDLRLFDREFPESNANLGGKSLLLSSDSFVPD